MSKRSFFSAFALICIPLFLQLNIDNAFASAPMQAKQAVELANDVLTSNKGNNELIAQALSLRSLAQSNLGNYQEALRDAHQAQRTNPTSALPLMARARAAALLGGYDQALKDLKEAATQDPDFFNNYGGPLLRAICLILSHKNNRQAVVDLERALTQQDKDSRLWLLLGRAKLDQGKSEEALEAFSKALELNPNMPEAYYWRARARAEQDNIPSQEAIKALADINSYLALKPGDGNGLALRALILSTLGEYRRFLRDAEKALEVMGGTTDEQRWLYGLENLFWDLNIQEKPSIALGVSETASLLDRPELAPISEALYNTALIFNPKSDYALTRRGRDRLLQGRVLVALDDLKRARAMGQRTTLNGLLLSQAIRLAYPPGQTAIPILNEVLADQPDNVDGLIMRAEINLELGKTQTAIRDLKKAVGNDPVSVKAALLLAEALVQQNKPNQALEVLEASAAIHSGRGDIQLARGQALLGMGQWQTALTALTMAVQLMPDSEKALVLRARAYVKLNQNSDAKKDLAKAIDLNPADIQALDELDRIRALGR